MTSESQKRASQKWKDKNKERSNYLKSRSSARSFFRTKATLEDLAEFEAIIQERRKQLEAPTD